MNTVLKNSLITGLLFIAPQLTNADDSEKPNSALGDVKKQPINKAQYVIAPASPYYTVTEPDKSKVLEHLAVGPKTLPLSVANSSPLDANELENIIRELKILSNFMRQLQLQTLITKCIQKHLFFSKKRLKSLSKSH